jgi:Mor family transcriptional regulator
MAEPRSNGPELLQELRDHTVHVLVGHGLEAIQAASIAADLVDRMRRSWGGQQVYFPVGLAFDIEDKHWAIWTDYNGRNRDEVCRKHSISVQHFYRIIDRIRQLESQRTQPGLFPEE